MSHGLYGRLWDMPDPAAVARAVLDRNRYLTLATADADGRPWSSPVWFACEEHRRFWWVSRPGAVHSRNIARRPEVAAVVFDSTVVPGTAELRLYRAEATELSVLGATPGGRDERIPVRVAG